MKKASSDEGEEIDAAEGAPDRAFCLYCGGGLLLRHRKLMGGENIIYYWRHLDNKSIKCPGRSRSYR